MSDDLTRLTDEEREQITDSWSYPTGGGGYFYDPMADDGERVFAAVESILAARLAGGPTLADAWETGYTTGSTDCARFLGWATSEVPSARPKDRTNPYRTPESEDTE